MGAQYKIIVKNMTSNNASFYVFQRQASFTGSGSGATVYSSSLATGQLAPSASSGAQLEFGFDIQVYAGAVCRNPTTSLAVKSANTLTSTAFNTASLSAAVQPISLTTVGVNTSANYTNLLLNPLGLSAPYNQAGLSVGCFGFQVPIFGPSDVEDLFCGCAMINQDSSIVLSSFLTPKPSSQLYCAPLPIFYVKIGAIPVGQIIIYDTGNAGPCDFTSGARVISVEYNPDGTFTVTVDA
ncbi:hypothetical protein [Ancylobacter sp. IITR112]|uniref:hypothetical protein n=1 Tax=Ancylobacter sp. IITR112 TaxID=3138073 RepID=UPI00352BCBA7